MQLVGIRVCPRVEMLFSEKLLGIFLLLMSQVLEAQPGIETNNPDKSTYLVAISDNPPLSFLNEENKAAGLIVDLINEMARQEGFEIDWVFDDWNIILNKTKKQQIDMLTSVGITAERQKYLTYSTQSFIASWSSIYLPRGSSVNNFLDLNNKTIAILTDDINGKFLKERCLKFEIHCNFIETQTYQELFEKVANAQVDAIVSNNIAGTWYANKYNLLSSSIFFKPSNTHVAVPINSNKYLLNTFDRYMQQWKKKENSAYYQIKSKWMASITEDSLPKTFLYFIYGLIMFAIMAFLTAVTFKRQVKKRVAELSIRNQQFNQIINLVPHIIYVSDAKGNILVANKKASQFFGMTPEEAQLYSIDNINEAKHDSRSYLNDNKLSKNLSHERLQEIETCDYQNNKTTLLLSKMPFKSHHNNHTQSVTVAVDITEMKAYQRQIIQMAHYDGLSNLPNLVVFKKDLTTCLERCNKSKKQGAFLYLDLDSFKDINDSHGHSIGDLLIQAVAKRLMEIAQNNKVYHYGGDEFAINLENLCSDVRHAHSLATDYGQKILQELSRPFNIKQRIFQISSCIGAIIYPHHGKSNEVLLQRSDTALNKAKCNGRNTICFFTTELEKSVIQRHQLENELQQAYNNDEFKLLYQPIIQGSNQRVVGCEALLRWHHPKKGIIQPIEFIQTAEKIHLMVKIGYWVVEQACMRIKNYLLDREEPPAANQACFIAVNISVVQLKDEEFYHKIEQLMSKYAIPKNCLEFEITESILMDDVELSIAIFNKIKQLGIKISIDDFGTGYSSFSYLVKLPIDKIKIDQSFVKELPHDKNSSTLVRTMIKMAKELKIKVLAEGIEKQEHYDFLIKENCDYYQGYYFDKPLKYSKLLQKII